MEKVLILDANQRSTLAATRSLGSKGIPVVVADETKDALAGSSKYSKDIFSYPSPYEFPEDFISTLRDEAIKRNIKLILPMTEITTHHLLKWRHRFEGFIIPFAPFQIFDLLNNKWKLFELARDLGLPTPLTYFINTSEDLSDIIPKLTFPIVIKPYRSRILFNGKWTTTSVKYATSITHLKHIIAKTEYLNTHPFLIQNYIQGEGQGIFTLYKEGAPIVFFAHRRLREKPPSGGVSVLSESYQVDPGLQQITRKILDHVLWHGPAMVEFKVASDGSPYLIEINARFWGSLQLAIYAGVDFPLLVYNLAIGKSLDNINSYKIAIKNRWLMGDLDHLYITLFHKYAMQSDSFSKKCRTLINFLNFFDRDTFFEVNRWDDMKPFVLELKNYFFDKKQ
jgi:predicted ATP-grasp superfamily ATP-dependent carboligase